MQKIIIVTDSTTDLPKELLEQHRIEVIPLQVDVNGKTYLDNVTISPLTFLEQMKLSTELPRTSQPSVGAFVEAYDRLGVGGETILSIHMTGGMSGTYQTACMAAEMSTSNVQVVDSKMISQALGFQVIEAARMANEGSSVQSIVERLKDIFDRTALFVVVDTLEYLIKGGRIGKAAGWIGSLFHIKPISRLQNGVISPVSKARSYVQVIQSLMEQFAQDTKGKTIRGIGISHADNLSVAEKLQKQIALMTGVPVRICPATPVITAHTGPGAIGFMYYTD
ncbi:DegV family protein [Cohnella faecalis]|uniref:DegV family protein n=1 Tax=Cohnella faecalis TaxID=2315694 RepID=A0A398CH05_9BACL|nr:DegV family protein [Cohnella faecalis]RIE02486.1 DegV family protein [Cohnella faecalis]